MATLALVLSALSAATSVATLIIVLKKPRREGISSQKMYWDSRLGVYANRPEDLQRYRDSIAGAAENSLPNS